MRASEKIVALPIWPRRAADQAGYASSAAPLRRGDSRGSCVSGRPRSWAARRCDRQPGVPGVRPFLSTARRAALGRCLAKKELDAADPSAATGGHLGHLTEEGLPQASRKPFLLRDPVVVHRSGRPGLDIYDAAGFGNYGIEDAAHERDHPTHIGIALGNRAYQAVTATATASNAMASAFGGERHRPASHVTEKRSESRALATVATSRSCSAT